jgi:hypothetical protein
VAVLSICHEGTARAFQARFGGDVRCEKQREGHHQRAWRWRVQGDTAARCLEELEPRLIVKREQARVGAEFFREKRRYKTLPAAELEKRESYRRRIWALNGYSTKKRRALVVEQDGRSERPSAETLKELYVQQGLLGRDLAERYGVHPSTIRDWLDGAGIPRRGRGPTQPEAPAG